MTDRVLLDANVLLRFLLDDHPTLSPRARQVFSAAASGEIVLVLTDLVLAEAVWVLSSFYKLERSDIALQLSTFLGLAGMECANLELIQDSLSRYAQTNCDFADCYLAAIAAANQVRLASFDADFRKFPDVELWRRNGAEADAQK